MSIRVAQETSLGAEDFDTNVLGTIEGFATSETAEDFYGWTPSIDRYGGTDPEPLADTSQLFIIDSSADGLSLALLHDSPDGGGASAFLEMTVSVDGDPDGLSWLVQDDPAGNPGTFNDTYTGSDGDFVFSKRQRWVDGFTDGAVLGALDGNWTAFVTFDAVPSDIGTWVATSSAGQALGLDAQSGGRVQLQMVPEANASAMWLLALGFFTVLGRSQKVC